MNGQEITMKFDELLDITKQSFATFLAHTEQAIREERPLLLAVDEEAIDPDKLALDVALVRAAPVAVSTDIANSSRWSKAATPS
jgi:hypothetical protein